MSLFSFLDGARLVKHDEDNDLTLVYFGGAGIHAYDANGKEVSYWTTSLTPTLDIVAESMQRHIDESYYP